MTVETQRPPEANYFISKLAHFILRIFGWSVVGQVPNLPKMVIVGAPHTSNWDGAVFYLYTLAVRAHLSFIGKHTLFKPPFGGIMRWAGGIPVNRTTTKNAVDQVVDAFNEHEKMALVVAAEGTRSYAPYWKTGFYYIALGAHVPIVLGFLNYPKRQIGIGPMFTPTGDIEADFKRIQDFYADKVGLHPEKQGPVALPPKGG